MTTRTKTALNYRFGSGVIIAIFLLFFPASLKAQDFVHGLSLEETLKYPPDFQHLDYVNPEAPRGGRLRLGTSVNFNNFNILSISGIPAPGLGLIYNTLMNSVRDEIFSQYCSLCEGVAIAADRSSITYRLRSGLKWHDGEALTSEDVVWTFQAALGENGLPTIQAYLQGIKKIEALNDRDVIFHLDPNNPELPLIIGTSLPILPKHVWENRDITKVSLDMPVGSGAYQISTFKSNDQILYTRVKDYWKDALPLGVGFNNFEEMHYVVFKDRSVWREAARAGEIDVFVENVAKEWATGYEIDAVKQGDLIKEVVEDGLPHGMQSFVYNLRRDFFKDVVLRRALSYAFDFEWTNANLFYHQYTRTKSFFGAPQMSADQLPDEEELAILRPLRDQLPPEVFTEIYEPPATDGSPEALRKNLGTALALLQDADYVIKDRQLYAPGQEAPLRFELLLYGPEFERIALPFKRNAERLGITIDIVRIDPTEYVRRIETQDFDMAVLSWGQSLSPGNEQYGYWGSEKANAEGTQNYSGIALPVIDRIIDNLVVAKGRDKLLAAIRALDRVLLHQHFVIPHWHSKGTRYVYRKGLMKPPPTLRGTDISTWWHAQ